MHNRTTSGILATAIAVAAFVTSISLITASPATAAAADSISLGTATPFAVLAGSAVTNTGTSVINGNVGVSPGTSIGGFPPGVLNGTSHSADSIASGAKDDLTTAYNSAAALTPTTTGLSDLVGLSLVPGVYSGNELSLSGTLTLKGNANSIWVFQAASTLITASSSTINITGGATSCNVFWQVGSSATLGSGSKFVGTIMANESITADTAATIRGRLLARTSAVTLDTNTLTSPAGCTVASGSPAPSSPKITSGHPTTPHLNSPYSFLVKASGSPAPHFSVTTGALPTGLHLNGATGLMSGTPTVTGTFTFTITATNASGPSSSREYSLTVAAALALTGVDPRPALTLSGGLILAGAMLYLSRRTRVQKHRA